jgi:mannose-6-phosphate isomerase-like protein (cupin superfamily)
MLNVNTSPEQILGLRSMNPELAAIDAPWREKLTSATPDENVGIRHAALEGNEQWREHVASIQVRVGCHFHKTGNEDYSIVQGSGVMHFGKVATIDGKPTVTSWLKLDVKTGDAFTIPEGYAHQLVSTGEKELVIVFACPDSQLNDSQDRTIIANASGVL